MLSVRFCSVIFCSASPGEDQWPIVAVDSADKDPSSGPEAAETTETDGAAGASTQPKRRGSAAAVALTGPLSGPLAGPLAGPSVAGGAAAGALTIGDKKVIHL